MGKKKLKREEKIEGGRWEDGKMGGEGAGSFYVGDLGDQRTWDQATTERAFTEEGVREWKCVSVSKRTASR